MKWIPTDAKKFHIQAINKHVVPGGVDSDDVTYIGRIFYQGELLVAKVCGYDTGDAKFWFPAGNEEKNVDSYEVLIYDTTLPTQEEKDVD